jgi:hypothetical protein
MAQYLKQIIIFFAVVAYFNIVFAQSSLSTYQWGRVYVLNNVLSASALHCSHPLSLQNSPNNVKELYTSYLRTNRNIALSAQNRIDAAYRNLGGIRAVDSFQTKLWNKTELMFANGSHDCQKAQAILVDMQQSFSGNEAELSEKFDETGFNYIDFISK